MMLTEPAILARRVETHHGIMFACEVLLPDAPREHLTLPCCGLLHPYQLEALRCADRHRAALAATWTQDVRDRDWSRAAVEQTLRPAPDITSERLWWQ